MADFLTAYKKTSKTEGGYANVAKDNGGETYAGISRKFFPKWPGWAIVDKNKPLKHNQVIKNDILHEMIQEFYKQNFWDNIEGDKIEDQPTAERLYDFGVNAGKPTTLKEIQGVLGIARTGKADEATIDAINNPGKYLA